MMNKKWGQLGLSLESIETSLVLFVPLSLKTIELFERAFFCSSSPFAKNKLRLIFLYDSHSFNLFSPFQIIVLGTGSDVPTINVFHLLIYVMVRMTVGTIQMKTNVGIEEKVSRNLS